MNTTITEQVAALHEKAFIVDAHFDLTYEVANRRERGETKVVETSYLGQLHRGGFNLIVSALFIHDYFLPEMGLRRALDQISRLHEEIDESPGKFRLCTTTIEARLAAAKGDLAIFLSLEGADPLQNDINLLRIFYELGVRGLGLAWSRRNYAADGAFFTSKRTGRKGGLTPFGIELVERAEKLGMFVDVSHLNDEGFWDVLDIAQRPIIASHSNCRALAGTMRNLTDEQIEAIAKNDGVIGVNSIDRFIHEGDTKATISHFVDHVDHIVKIAGIDHVGIGFDLCDSFKNFLSMEKELPSKDVIETHAGSGKFTAELIRRGYNEEAVLAILGGNFMRIFEQIIE